MKKGDLVWKELREHLPFTLLISLMAGFLVAVFYNLGRVPSEELFEFLHPAHVLVSAVATSAIYWRYNKNYLKAVLIGVVGAILIGSLSDVLLPWLAGNLFSLHTHFHLPILEKPLLILSLALIGAIVGMYWDLFETSHLLHVFLSVFASLFYLLAFSVSLSVWGVVLISGLVFLAVYVPCCISDIVFPLLFIEKACKGCGRWH
ncbi:hypothetical protein HNV12_02725 [Methanococcoides sp. SA1]|nr:hypothetical protein [Methanococcoides sp. SA1]